ncbi:endoglucanase [Candidatus Fermentibacteria bacterium]|nr:MAG: endoglucanase [Candidatus Fermentibacteria bacterium]
MKFLKKLCETDGISGREDAVAELLKEELKEYADEIRTDAMKNVIALKKGTAGNNRKKIMLAGHIDEIGFLIYNINKEGFASISPVGGWSAGSIAGHTVKVYTCKGEVLRGVVCAKAALTPEEAAKAPDLNSLFIDFGMDGDTVKEKVQRGDWVAMDSPYQELGDCLVAKAFDDRVGVYIITEAFRKYRNPNIDVYCVGTAQEEVGIRGATVAAQSVRPDIGIAADITVAGDTPGFPAERKVTDLGKGVAIKQQDSSVICSTSLVDFMRTIAEEKGIDYQMEILVRGGTDTSAMQKFGGDTYATCLSVPTRNGHSPVAIIHKHDVETAIKLLTEFLNRAHLFQG